MNTTVQEFNLKRFIDKPNEIFNVPVKYIQVKENWNTREDYGNIPWLSHSITENGQRDPVVLFAEYTDEPTEQSLKLDVGFPKAGYPEGYYNLYISDGHRRFAAINMAIANGAEIVSIKARSTSKQEKEADRLLDQILMNSGKNLTALEQQKIFRRLSDYGWSQAEICRKTGMSPAHVANMLTLSTVEVGVKEAIEREELNASLVIHTLSEVREIAVKEKKSETEVYQMLIDFYKEQKDNKPLSTAKAKKALSEYKRQKLSRTHEKYYDSLTPNQLMNELFISNLGLAETEEVAVLKLPRPLMDALRKHFKSNK